MKTCAKLAIGLAAFLGLSAIALPVADHFIGGSSSAQVTPAPHK